jgi:hypothetical protein
VGACPRARLDVRRAYQELIPTYAQLPGVLGGSPSRAEALLERWQRIHPYTAGLARVRFDVARNLPQQTVADAEALVRAFPDSARPLAELATAYLRVRRLADTEAALTRGLARDPEHPYLLLAAGAPPRRPASSWRAASPRCGRCSRTPPPRTAAPARSAPARTCGSARSSSGAAIVRVRAPSSRPRSRSRRGRARPARGWSACGERPGRRPPATPITALAWSALLVLLMLLVLYVVAYGVRYVVLGRWAWVPMLAASFEQRPRAISLHALGGSLVLAAGLLQLRPGIRRRVPAVHRAVGWLYASRGRSCGWARGSTWPRTPVGGGRRTSASACSASARSARRRTRRASPCAASDGRTAAGWCAATRSCAPR